MIRQSGQTSLICQYEIIYLSIMNMKEKNAKKSKIHQLGFSFLKRESNYLDRQRQAILVCFSVMLSLGILSNILGLSGAFDSFFTVSNIVFLNLLAELKTAWKLVYFYGEKVVHLVDF